jgi:SNF2 family DNA or RNA helicase
LQSIVCGFWNYDKNWARRDEPREMVSERYAHGRVAALLSIVRQIPESEKVIIWTKFRYCLEEITDALRNEYGESSVVRFYGDLSPKKREAELARFRGGARFFVATQSCGGHGLTLNEANHVIFYADGFKYSERNQAEDRCHRIGQTKPVTYITIRSESGIDDRIANSLSKKSDALQDFREEIRKIKGEGIREKLREFVAKL